MTYQNSTYKRPVKLVNGKSVDNLLLFSFWASLRKCFQTPFMLCQQVSEKNLQKRKEKNELRRKTFWKLLFCRRWKVGNAVIGSKTCFHQQPKIKWKVAFMKKLRNIFQAKGKCANIGLSRVTFSRNSLCSTWNVWYQNWMRTTFDEYSVPSSTLSPRSDTLKDENIALSMSVLSHIRKLTTFQFFLNCTLA